MSNMCVAAACGGPGGTGSSYGAVWQRSGGASSSSANYDRAATSVAALQTISRSESVSEQPQQAQRTWRISRSEFITNGPYWTIGSPMGLPQISRNLRPASEAVACTCGGQQQI